MKSKGVRESQEDVITGRQQKKVPLNNSQLSNSHLQESVVESSKPKQSSPNSKQLAPVSSIRKEASQPEIGIPSAEGASGAKAEAYQAKHLYLKVAEDKSMQPIDIVGDLQGVESHGQGAKGYFVFYRVLWFTTLLMAACSAGPLYFNILGINFTGIASQLSIYTLAVGYTSLGNNSQYGQTDFLVTTILGCAATLFLIILSFVGRTLLARSRKAQYENLEVAKSERFTVRATGFGDKYTDEATLRRAFQVFGQVNSVLLVRDTKGEADSIVEYCRTRFLHKQLSVLNLQNGQSQNCRLECAAEGQTLKQIKVGPPVMAFIEFEREESKMECLLAYKSHGLHDSCGSRLLKALNCCREPLEEKYRCNDLELRVSSWQIPQPEDLVFQNLDASPLTRFFKALAIIFALLLIAVVGQIFMAAVLAAFRTTCATTYTLVQAVAAGSGSTQAICHCSSQISFAKVCQESYSRVSYEWWKLLVIAGIATVFNWFTLGVSHVGGKWLRFQTRSSGLLFSVGCSVFFCLVNTVVLPLLLTANIYGYKPNSGLLFLVKWFNVDTSGFLYFADTDQLFLLHFASYIVFYSLLSLALPLLKLLGASLSYCCRTPLQDDSRLAQSQLNQLSLYYKFHFDLDLAEVLTNLFATAALGHGVPVLYPLLFLNLALRYPINNYLVLRHSAKEAGLSPSLIVALYRFLPAAAFLNYLFGCWIITANYTSLFYSTVSLFSFSGSTALSIVSRWLQVSYCWILAVFALLYIVLDLVLYRCGALSCCLRADPVDRQESLSKFQERQRQKDCSFNLRLREGYNGVQAQIIQLQRECRMQDSRRVDPV